MDALAREDAHEQAFYDEFAIGWNEIFDQEAPASGPAREALPRASPLRGSPAPLAPSSARRPAAAPSTPSSAWVGLPPPPLAPRSAREPVVAPPVQSAVQPPPPSSARPSMIQRTRRPSPSAGGEQRDGVNWTSEVLNSRKLPEYMRISGGKQSAIERGMKEQLLACPTSQLRKPAQVMEVELEALRTTLTLAHSAKRKEARQNRWLQRRCRVKPHEDLDALEARYPPHECLRPLPDPVESALTDRRPAHPLAKEFFGALRSCQRTSPPPPARPVATWRVGGAASHRVPWAGGLSVMQAKVPPRAAAPRALGV